MLWQSSQTFEVGRCDAALPVAVVPLWQDAQLPVTAAWLNVAFDQDVVLWQSSQVFGDAM